MLKNNQKRNIFGEQALKEAEHTIKKMCYKSEPASLEFKSHLREEILKKRQKTIMNPFHKLTPKKLAPIVASLLVLCIVLGSFYYFFDLPFY